MSSLVAHSDHRPGLVERLRAALRPEFADDVILVDTADPVMGGPACRVLRCDRVGVGRDVQRPPPALGGRRAAGARGVGRQRARKHEVAR